MGYDVDNGYSMWDDVKEFYSKAWSQRIEPFALTEFMSAVNHLVAYDVKRALRRIYRTQDRPLRPAISQVVARVYEIKAEDTFRSRSKAGPQRECKHCNGKKCMEARVFAVHRDDLPADFKPNKLMREYRSGYFIVEPEAAKAKGMSSKAVRLWCDYCSEVNHKKDRYKGCSVKEFGSRYKGFFLMFFPSDMRTVNKLINEKEAANVAS